MDELENVLAIPREEVILASAKDGTGVAEILEAIVARIPAPKGDPTAPAPGPHLRQPLRRLQGRRRLRPAGRRARSSHGEPIRLMASGAEAELLELGVFRPQLVPVKQLVAGEVGYVATGLKSVRDAQVGDTRHDRRPAGGRRRCPATRRPRASSSPASTRSAARTTRSCATRSRSSTSTTRASPTSRRARSRSASGSAAASSACSTWRSSRSASSASSTSTSSRRRRRSSTTSS